MTWQLIECFFFLSSFIQHYFNNDYVLCIPNSNNIYKSRQYVCSITLLLQDMTNIKGIQHCSTIFPGMAVSATKIIPQNTLGIQFALEKFSPCCCRCRHTGIGTPAMLKRFLQHFKNSSHCSTLHFNLFFFNRQIFSYNNNYIEFLYSD